MEELKQDIKEIKKELKEVGLVMARNTASLEIHIKRSDLLESRTSKIEWWVIGILGSAVLTLIGKTLF